MLPNFLFIGPAKSASTWIFEVLKSHPEVYVPPCKDIYFFDKYYNKGLDWYSAHFIATLGKTAVGELSHDYLFSDEACERIDRDLPKVRLILCLRNPVDRLYSDYLFNRKHGLVSGDVFDALKSDPEILRQSCYYQPVKRYVDRFGRDRVLILDFQEIKERPEKVVEDLYRFLNVDPGFKPPASSEVVLPASYPRNRMLALISKKFAQQIRDMGFSNLLGRIKHSPLVNRLLYKPYTKDNFPRLSLEDRHHLYGLLKEDIVSLEKFLDARFESWHVKE